MMGPDGDKRGDMTRESTGHDWRRTWRLLARARARVPLIIFVNRIIERARNVTFTRTERGESCGDPRSACAPAADHRHNRPRYWRSRSPLMIKHADLCPPCPPSTAVPDALPRTSDLSQAARYHASFPWKRAEGRRRPSGAYPFARIGLFSLALLFPFIHERDHR